jgi:hypothetical protein
MKLTRSKQIKLNWRLHNNLRESLIRFPSFHRVNIHLILTNLTFFSDEQEFYFNENGEDDEMIENEPYDERDH